MTTRGSVALAGIAALGRDRVWPWIVQMGFPSCRGGWYTPYWLDRVQWGITERSADLNASVMLRAIRCRAERAS